MSLESIISDIDAEISRLQQAKQVLGGLATKRNPGRPPSKVVAGVSASKPKRKLSEAARARIGAAQKARWAKARKAASKNGVAVR